MVNKIRNYGFHLNMLWRSFFLQALWNYECLQNIGFAYALLPFFRKLYSDPAKRKEALLRHIAFFNTHPYMVNLILGIVASLEKEMAAGKEVKSETITAIKNNMAGPLAAIGDTFFWAIWRPFVALVSVGVVLLFYRSDGFCGTLMAPVLFVLIYNILHITFRYLGQKMGFELRNRAINIIAKVEFRYFEDVLRLTGVLLLVGLVVYYFFTFALNFENRIVYSVVFLATVLSGYLKLSAEMIFYGIISFGLVFMFLKG